MICLYASAVSFRVIEDPSIGGEQQDRKLGPFFDKIDIMSSCLVVRRETRTQLLTVSYLLQPALDPIKVKAF